MKIAVSACLLGENCKYNGGNNYRRDIVDFLKGHDILPICPELLAGAGVPRKCVELQNGRAIDSEGISVDKEYRRGAALALKQVQIFGAELVILKSRSPTCGVRRIYDGTFTGELIDGEGLFARQLLDCGILVRDSDDF